MIKTIEYVDFEKNFSMDDSILIDVRSPSEYDLETIPNSINLPLFDDEERRIIGTTYKRESSDRAKKLGVEFVSKKLPLIYDEIEKLNKKYRNLIFFCARGGYRSSSISSFLSSIGINTLKLNNGYKGYRQYINNKLPEIVSTIDFIVLYGNTGTGKTKILKELKEINMNIVDLEGAANHRGSTLGSIGLGVQRSQKMFESYIYEDLKNLNSNIVFIEGESRRIGKDIVPDYIFNKMKNGIHLNIVSDLPYRVENIYEDYVHNTDHEIINSLNYLRKYLGNESIDTYIKLVHGGDHKKVIENLMLNYYDPMYQNNKRNFVASFYNKDHKKTAEEIQGWTRANYL